MNKNGRISDGDMRSFRWLLFVAFLGSFVSIIFLDVGGLALKGVVVAAVVALFYRMFGLGIPPEIATPTSSDNSNDECPLPGRMTDE